jgi:hypothetical protein
MADIRIGEPREIPGSVRIPLECVRSGEGWERGSHKPHKEAWGKKSVVQGKWAVPALTADVFAVLPSSAVGFAEESR